MLRSLDDQLINPIFLQFLFHFFVTDYNNDYIRSIRSSSLLRIQLLYTHTHLSARHNLSRHSIMDLDLFGLSLLDYVLVMGLLGAGAFYLLRNKKNEDEFDVNSIKSFNMM